MTIILDSEQQKYLDSFRTSSPEVKLPEEYESSKMRQLQYGFGKADWLGTSAFRYIAAGGDEELLKEKEKERLRELDRKYSDLSAEDLL